MILDDLLEFCDAVDCTMTVGNKILGDVIDTGDAPTLKNLGVTPVYLVLTVDTAFTGTAGATGQFQLCTDSTANLATSKTVHVDSGALSLASLAAGKTYCYPLPSNGTYERYMGIWITNATQDFTAGKINAFLTLDPAPYLTALPDAL